MSAFLNIADRISVEKGILSSQGDERAQSINVFGSEEIAIDAILGGVFGSISHLGARAKDRQTNREQTPQPDLPNHIIDAAMTAERARFEDAQVLNNNPVVQERADFALTEHARSIDELRGNTSNILQTDDLFPSNAQLRDFDGVANISNPIHKQLIDLFRNELALV
ncbi:MAG: hypothetical protein E6Q35_05535, partial [Chryseobacterium cucumeris]